MEKASKTYGWIAGGIVFAISLIVYMKTPSVTVIEQNLELFKQYVFYLFPVRLNYNITFIFTVIITFIALHLGIRSLFIIGFDLDETNVDDTLKIKRTTRQLFIWAYVSIFSAMMFAQFLGEKLSDFNFIEATFGLLAGLITYPVYTVFFLFWPAVLIGFLVATSPVLMAGVVALKTRHPAAGAISRTLVRDTSDPHIEKQVVGILRLRQERQNAMTKKIENMSSWRSWLLRMELKADKKEADRIAGLINARRGADEADMSLARATHELERTRRAKVEG